MYQQSQVHKKYLHDIQLILNVALLNKAHFFKATNDFSVEPGQLEKEQSADLAGQDLDWWEAEPMSEEQYYNQLAETRGFK